MNIYVGNLPYSMTQDDLNDLFAPFGAIASARIVNDRETGRSKGFGFVEMNNAAEANQAIEAMNNKEIDGRKLVVNEARPREERPQGGFGGGERRGGFGGGGDRRGGFGGGGDRRGGNGGGSRW